MLDGLSIVYRNSCTFLLIDVHNKEVKAETQCDCIKKTKKKKTFFYNFT